jgi:cell wall-associated NlpC family hydrolase
MEPISIPMLGDTLVFKRPGGGHVGIYVGEDSQCYHVMGGNQSNAYGFTRIAKGRLVAARRPKYINQPENVRVIHLAATGAISKDEA